MSIQQSCWIGSNFRWSCGVGDLLEDLNRGPRAGRCSRCFYLRTIRTAPSLRHMALDTFDTAIRSAVRERRAKIEAHFASPVVYYQGPIVHGVHHILREILEVIRRNDSRDRLVMVVNTMGGTIETVEKMVEITRYHYREVSFIVPDQAMSAGTVLCMSGNKIYMDYASSLGPIDPQVPNKENNLVPAMGYLNQVEKMIEKSKKGELSQAEVVILSQLDLGTLASYENARELAIDLLKRWLVEHKFQDWHTHRTHPEKMNQPVTLEEKVERAEEIARKLSDVQIWHSHSRPIGRAKLRKELRLEIDDYPTDDGVADAIRGYNDLLVEFCRTKNLPFWWDHSADQVP